MAVFLYHAPNIVSGQLNRLGGSSKSSIIKNPGRMSKLVILVCLMRRVKWQFGWIYVGYICHNEIPRDTMLGLLADLPIPGLAAPLLIRKLSQLSLDGKLDDNS